MRSSVSGFTDTLTHPLQALARGFKVHLDERTAVTSQLFFPEPVNDAVMGTSPYRDEGARDTRNAADSIFSASAVLEVVPEAGGYRASLVIGVSA
ncbi:MAG TPA: hypothetical protein VIG29_13040 [Vicinamibacteria bacterium]